MRKGSKLARRAGPWERAGLCLAVALAWLGVTGALPHAGGQTQTAPARTLGEGSRTGHWIDTLDPRAFDQANRSVALAILGTSFVNPSSCTPRVELRNLSTGVTAALPAVVESLTRVTAVIPAEVAGTPGSYAVGVRFYIACGYGAIEESRLSNEQQLDIVRTDLTEPETLIASAPRNSTSTTASFEFTGTDNFTPAGRLRFQCRLDGGAFAPCSGRADFPGLSLGKHTLEVRAVDQAGNTDPSPAAHSWEVWSTVTDTLITSGPANNSASREASATFTFSGTDDDTPPERLAFECGLDSITFAPCTSPQAYSNLTPLGHLFRVRAKDAAGNADPTPASVFWYVDTIPPETEIQQRPPAEDRSPTAAFVFGSTDNVNLPRSFECSLDGGEFSPCSNPHTYTGLTRGSHTFRVRARDAAGNVDESPASYTWTIRP